MLTSSSRILFEEQEHLAWRFHMKKEVSGRVERCISWRFGKGEDLVSVIWCRTNEWNCYVR